MKAPKRGFLGCWLRLLALLLLLTKLAAAAAHAQVLDDSTKVLYGPKTTRVIYEAEVLRDSTGGTLLDTTLTRFPQDRFWAHDTTFQQDLGALGTASRPLLYQPNLQLGARFGRDVFNKYAHDASQIPYYDSRSPFSFFRYIQSGAGEQVFEFNYSRSLKKNFSVGFNYERIASNKILATTGGTGGVGRGLVEHSNLMLYGRLQSENERYHLLFNIGNARHSAAEQGGIWPIIRRALNAETGDSITLGESAPNQLFNYGAQRVYLTKAINREDRDELYFTQTYRLLGRGLTVYHTFDAKRQFNNYSDTELTPLNRGELYFPRVRFYPRVLRNTRAILDRAEFKQVENTFGVLGRTDFAEYRLYGRLRNASLATKTLYSNQVRAARSTTGDSLVVGAPTRTFTQAFVGGTVAFNYHKIYAVEAAGEYKLFDEYWLRASVRTGPLWVEALRSSYSPTLTQQELVGNNYEWHHLPGTPTEFSNTSSTQLTGRLRFNLPDIGRLSQQRFEASASLVNLTNLVYYNTAGMPEQATVAKNLQVVFARHQVHFGRVGFDNQATYTQGGDVTGIRIPKLVTNSRVFYESYIFRKALFSQTGIQVYYQSAYKAFDYSPSTQQFYQQDHFTITNHAVADVFFSADIKAVSAFLKVAYVNQGIISGGYFTTPYYTGYPRRFQFGVRWNFFN